jgi:hypothetical protein
MEKELIKDDDNESYQNTEYNIGEFNVTSEKMIITDMSYTSKNLQDNMKVCKINNMKIGKWKCDKIEDYKDLTVEYLLFHNDVEKYEINPDNYKETDMEITVSTNSVGVISKSLFENDNLKDRPLLLLDNEHIFIDNASIFTSSTKNHSAFVTNYEYKGKIVMIAISMIENFGCGETLLGSFKITSKDMIISDPCYGPKDKSKKHVSFVKMTNIKKGIWYCYEMIIRPHEIIYSLRHECMKNDCNLFDKCNTKEFEATIDSGELAFFPYKNFCNDEYIMKPSMKPNETYNICDNEVIFESLIGDTIVIVECLEYEGKIITINITM